MARDKPNPAKELYRQLREASCRQLWEEEVPRFDRADACERLDRVGLIRAVGVVFSESGTPPEKEAARTWLRGLLQDPAEKIRRYAMTALPKLGADRADEAEMLALLGATTAERERKFLGRSLDKIGGAATLEALPLGSGDGFRQTEQKVTASLARREEPSTVQLQSALAGLPDLRIHLRCRRGLEQIVREEVEAQAKFAVAEVDSELVAVTCTGAFRLEEGYALRCFGTLGLVLGEAPAGVGLDALAAILASERTRQILRTFTAGPLRYRLEFMEKGHQRGAVRQLANLVYARCPELLNDARDAPWTVAIYPTPEGSLVELTPRLRPDPRFAYRLDAVPAASHPPLAACLARLAGPRRDENVWDPFCGSGLELIERTLLGGVRQVFGSDRDSEAITIARANFTHAFARPNPAGNKAGGTALASGVPAQFTCADFRDFARSPALGPNSLTLIITNPPLGKRVPIPNLRGLMNDLLNVAATTLRPGGRLVFPNPIQNVHAPKALELVSHRLIDMGGFDCRLESYRKSGRRGA